jgi:hypothetical protein
MAVLDGSEKCSIYGTDSFEVIQQIPCSETCKLTSAAFDPSGTILAIGGETRSLRSNTGGMVLIVRVGELLSLDFFCLETHNADPTRVCQKLSSLSAVERAQILFHRSETEESAAHGHFPLEQKISSGVASRKERDSKESLGSSVMRTERSSEAVDCVSESDLNPVSSNGVCGLLRSWQLVYRPFRTRQSQTVEVVILLHSGKLSFVPLLGDERGDAEWYSNESVG